MTRAYLIALSAVVAAAMLIAGALYAGARIEAHHAAGPGAPAWAAWALCLLWSLAWLGVATRLGPVTAVPATVAWILPSPLDRGRLLRKGALWACAAGAPVALVNAVLVVYALAPDVQRATAMLMAGAGGGVFAAATLVILQTYAAMRWRWVVVAAVFSAAAHPVVVGIGALASVVFALSTLDHMRRDRVARPVRPTRRWWSRVSSRSIRAWRHGPPNSSQRAVVGASQVPDGRSLSHRICWHCGVYRAGSSRPRDWRRCRPSWARCSGRAA